MSCIRWPDTMLVLPDGSAFARRRGVPCPCGNAAFGVWWDGKRYHVQCDGPRCCKPPKGGTKVGAYDCGADRLTMKEG